ALPSSRATARVRPSAARTTGSHTRVSPSSRRRSRPLSRSQKKTEETGGGSPLLPPFNTARRQPSAVKARCCTSCVRPGGVVLRDARLLETPGLLAGGHLPDADGAVGPEPGQQRTIRGQSQVARRQ